MSATAYFDASAIVRLLVPEPESLAIVEYLSHPRASNTSALSLTEVTRGMRRADPTRDDVEEALAGFNLVRVDDELLKRAGQIGPRNLRALDAIHLVSALALQEPDLEFVTYDDRLVAAARAHGLRVVQPGKNKVPGVRNVPGVPKVRVPRVPGVPAKGR